jgi:hypothetical protein
LAGETEVLGKKLPQCRFVHHKPHMLPGREPRRRGKKPANNSLSYGKAKHDFKYDSSGMSLADKSLHVHQYAEQIVAIINIIDDLEFQFQLQ